MPYIRIRNVTGIDIVTVPGIPTVPKHSVITTYIMRTSELERVQIVLSDLRAKKILEYQVYYQENQAIDNPVELATVQDVYDAVGGLSPGGGTGDWSGPGKRLYQQLLVGPVNGVNTVFSAPAKFITTATGREVVYMNGVAQLRGPTADYDIAESVPTAGYDLVVFAYPPKPGDSPTIDYIPA